MGFMDSEFFKFIPDLRKLNYDDIDENVFYKLINLSDNELEVIKMIAQKHKHYKSL